MHETLHSKRFNIVNQEHYEVDLEYNEQYAILHLPRVSKFNKTVYIDMADRLEQFAEFIKSSGYFGLWAAISPDNNVLDKLIKKLGFKYLGTSGALAVYEWENF